MGFRWLVHPARLIVRQTVYLGRKRGVIDRSDVRRNNTDTSQQMAAGHARMKKEKEKKKTLL